MTCRSCLIVLSALFLCPLCAFAQFGGGALFEPEISVVNSGVVMDSQATVSADRKYVTLTMRTQQSQLLDLQTFNFQNFGNGMGGIVGGVNPVIAGPNGTMIAIPQQPNAPMRVAPGNGGAILLKRGITPLLSGR
jgi:hypothetical protein